jgi:hypothetical protein
MKPSELTPLSALAMCDLAVEAGLPAGVLNTVPGLGSSTGAAIAGHMDIDKVRRDRYPADNRLLSPDLSSLDDGLLLRPPSRI